MVKCVEARSSAGAEAERSDLADLLDRNRGEGDQDDEEEELLHGSSVYAL